MRHAISRKLTHNLIVVLALACAFIFAMTAETFTVADRAPAVDSPADLVAAHDCWTGDAPADMRGRQPGHVVVTVKGHSVYAGPRMVNQALSQVFERVDHGLMVHAFCR